MGSTDHDFIFRAVVVGNARSGKSTFCKTYANGYSCIEKTPTIGVDFFAKKHKMEDESIIKLHLWDTAGQEAFRSIVSSYFKDISGSIILFDITDISSFDKVKLWLNDIRRLNTCKHEHPIILVGNKTDLEHKREVSHEDAFTYAKSENLMYVESSSYDIECVETIMHHLYTSMYNDFLKNIECRGVKSLNEEFSSNSISLKDFPQKSKCC